MITVKWVCRMKRGTEWWEVSITTSSPTLKEASTKMRDFVKEILKDGWELSLSEIKEIIISERTIR